MKLQMTLALLGAILPLAAIPAPALAAPKTEVAVCMDPTNDMDTIMSARDMASRIFAGAGIAIQWHGRKCPAKAIQITLSFKTPAKLMPDTVGYALPRQGTEVVLFYDRLKQSIESFRFTNLLAHVFVHELTHALQGVNRHSETGLMKAKWDERDYNRMDGMGLAFASEDIDLIHQGLARRAADLLQARQ